MFEEEINKMDPELKKRLLHPDSMRTPNPEWFLHETIQAIDENGTKINTFFKLGKPYPHNLTDSYRVPLEFGWSKRRPCDVAGCTPTHALSLALWFCATILLHREQEGWLFFYDDESPMEPGMIAKQIYVGYTPELNKE